MIKFLGERKYNRFEILVVIPALGYACMNNLAWWKIVLIFLGGFFTSSLLEVLAERGK